MDVIFELQRGRSFTIEVGFFDTVLEIKEKIQKYQSIPIQKQTLVFNGHVLNDERDIEYCEILHNSHIQLLISPEIEQKIVKAESPLPSPSPSPSPSPLPTKIKVNVKTPYSSKIHLSLEMDPNDTVLRLKQKIGEFESVSVNRLVIQSKGDNELHDHQSLRECELLDNCEINVSLRPSPTGSLGSTGSGGGGGAKKLMRIILTVPQLGSKKIPVDVNPSDRIEELRKEVHKLEQAMQLNLPQDGYFFIYKQNIMDEEHTFRWHHVCQGDVIEIFSGRLSSGS